MTQLDCYSAKCIFCSERIEDGKSTRVFEERVVLLHANDFDDAFCKARDEAQSYAKQTDSTFLACIGVFLIQDPLVEGIDLFSMLRSSNLAPDEYLKAITATGIPRNSFLFQSGHGESDP